MSSEVRTVIMHGHPVRFQQFTTGRRSRAHREVLVLLHGLAGSLHTWEPVLTELARRNEDRTVVAVDLAGHGGSIQANADCSPSGYATGVRDLLAHLKHRRVTVIGHSLGGAVAMQFAYQFPEWCERLVLVASGGLGRSVHPLLRAATLPGSEFVLPLLGHRALVGVARRLLELTDSIGVTSRSPEPLLFLEHLGALADAAGTATFTRTVRGALDLGGQRLTGVDRLPLLAELPTLVVWGDKDPIIPVGHARRVHDLVPAARVEVFEGAGHFPHCHRPDRFVELVADFLRGTVPARLDPMRILHGTEDTTSLAPTA